ncbi:hypothetical protein NLI96_g9705 [Meripilus lineatus]|uniref:Uncharacterized protein n=1 Tax=Meripilus lineatus TaxID=2056292 RepID=A0AAD5YCP1_9APHY|nr:hypothetical protein NLI96_g9705 [Physisporinus lineatus]
MSSTSQASWSTTLYKRDDPSIAEYAQQPNLTARSVKALIRKPSVIADPEAPPTPHEKPPTVISNESLSVQRNHDRNSLIFTLNLCFAFAGLAQFISLLVFHSQTAWDTGCAFIVAWGGMSSQCARLVGIIILTLDLKRSHIRRSESWSLWAGVVIALAFVFATNAVNTGTTRQLAPYGSFCFRKHSLPVPLTSSIIHLVLELYITTRLMTVRLPPSPRVWDIALSLGNVNMARAASLIALDLLTIVPDAIATSIVVQFVPFCLGALLVLAAFNVSLHTPGSPVLLVAGPIVNIDPTPSVASPKEAENDPASILNIAPTEPPKRKTGRNVSHASSMQSLETADTDIAGSVEGAVVSRAVRYMPSPETPAFPHSAPARFGDAAETIQGSRDRRHILPSQSLFVEEIEQPSQESGPTGPTVRRQAARPPMTIVVHPEDSDESHSPGAGTPGSAIFGSDIVQPTPGLRRVDEKSPAVDPHASVVLSPRDSVFTAQHPVHRDSTTSTQYVATPSEYSPEETRFSAFSRRNDLAVLIRIGENKISGRATYTPRRRGKRWSLLLPS